MANWIIPCRNTHQVCGRQGLSLAMPKRILEVTDGQLYLLEQPYTASVFACLSHRWGKTGPALKLNSRTIRRLTGGVPYVHLPKTFREAAILCGRIGLGFLWIDALRRFSRCRTTFY